ncbi:MAG: hypothetical protein RIT45_1285 [Pseudomonadota bacterium]
MIDALRAAGFHVEPRAGVVLARLPAGRPAFQSGARSAVAVSWSEAEAEATGATWPALAEVGAVAGRDLLLVIGEGTVDADALATVAVVVDAGGERTGDVRAIGVDRRAGGRLRLRSEAGAPLVRAVAALIAPATSFRPDPATQRMLDDLLADAGLGAAVTRRGLFHATTHEAACRRLPLPIGWDAWLGRDAVTLDVMTVDASGGEASLWVSLAIESSLEAWLQTTQAALPEGVTLHCERSWPRRETAVHGAWVGSLQAALAAVEPGGPVVVAPRRDPPRGLADDAVAAPRYGLFGALASSTSLVPLLRTLLVEG